MEFHRAQEILEKIINEVERYELNEKNSFFVFPFDLIAGYITNTDIGVNTTQTISDYSTFQRIFTGRENLIARWTDSTIIKNNDKKDNNIEYYFDRTSQVGRYFRGYSFEKQMGAIFNPSPIDNAFIQQSNKETLQMIVYEELNAKDLFKLYIVSEFLNNTEDPEWYYITKIIKYRKPNGEFFSTYLELSSLNIHLADTGQAINTLIQRGAIGAGYVWPKISADNQSVMIDNDRILHVGVDSIQSAYNGTGAWGSLFAYGRPISQPIFNVVDQKWEDKIYAPRLLLPYNLLTPTPSKIFTRQGSEGDYFFSQISTPQLETTYADWSKKRQAQLNPALLNAYEGLLNTNQLLEDLEKTNISSNPDNSLAPKFSLWNNNWKIQLQSWIINKTDPTKKNEVNLIEPSITHPLNYSLGGSSVAGEIIKDDSGEIYKSDYIQLANGSQKVKLLINQLLAHNIFILKKYTTLPMSIRHNTIWNFRNIPFIGGILSHLTGGIYFGWKNSNINFQSEPLMLLIPTTMVRYGLSTMAEEPKKVCVRIPLELFTSKSEFASAVYGGIPAINVIMKTSLTDRFACAYTGKNPKYQSENFCYVYNTNQLGQLTKNREVYAIYNWQNKVATEKVMPLINDPQRVSERVFWNGTSYPVEPLNHKNKYIIDSLVNYCLSKVSQQWTCYSDDIEIFNSVQKSFSEFAGSIRDWNNSLLTSKITPTNISPMKYPHDLITPTHPSIPKLIIEFPAFKNMGFKQQKYKNRQLDGSSPPIKNTSYIWLLFASKINPFISPNRYSNKIHMTFQNWKVNSVNEIMWLDSIVKPISTEATMPTNWKSYSNLIVDILDNYGKPKKLNIPVSQLKKGNVVTYYMNEVNNRVNVEIAENPRGKDNPSKAKWTYALIKVPPVKLAWWVSGKSGEEWKLLNVWDQWYVKYEIKVIKKRKLVIKMFYGLTYISWPTPDKNYTFDIDWPPPGPPPNKNYTFDKVSDTKVIIPIDKISLPFEFTTNGSQKIVSVKLFPN